MRAGRPAIRPHRPAAGVIALGLYGFVATLQPQGDFARVLAGMAVITYVPRGR